MIRPIIYIIFSLLATNCATAQNTMQSISIEKDSVPMTTIIPVEQPSYTLRDTITKPTTETKYMTRQEKREAKAERYAFHIDSLVATRSWAFYPTTMQAEPNGEVKNIYANYFYAYISPVDLEVHLPVEQTTTLHSTMMNFDTDGIRNYAAAKYLARWNIYFTANNDGNQYYFWVEISTMTGRTQLIVKGPDGTMQYEGSIGERIKQW